MVISDTAKYTILPILKIDLQICAKEYDPYLLSLIETAHQLITTEGIKLSENAEDYNLTEMYAAFLYRQRKGAQSEMPRSLRWALNNKLFSQKSRPVEEGD